MISHKTYRNYLIDLKDDVYKVLCLYEEKSETFDDYLHSLIFEIKNLKYVIDDDLPHRLWYIKTLTKLEGIARLESNWDSHKLVKKEVLDIMNRRIDREIDKLKGGW